MFGSSHIHTGPTTLISKSTEIVGDIHFSDHLEIEGTVRGNIIAAEKGNANVTVRHKGKVIGKIMAPRIIINGEVEGDVHSKQHIELAAKAMVRGNVYYHYLEVVKGAQVNGNMIHDPEKEGDLITDESTPGEAVAASEAEKKPVAAKGNGSDDQEHAATQARKTTKKASPKADEGEENTATT